MKNGLLIVLIALIFSVLSMTSILLQAVFIALGMAISLTLRLVLANKAFAVCQKPQVLLRTGTY